MMREEELDWFRLASHLHKSLDEVRMETTTTQFFQWMLYLNEIKPNESDPIHHYLASLAAEVRRSWVDAKHKRSVQLKDFLLRFKRDSNNRPKSTPAGDKGVSTKSFFFALTGLTGKKKPKR